MSTIEKLRDLPADAVKQMSLENAATVAKLPEKERDAETVAVACAESGTVLKKKVKAEKAHCHIDFSETISFKLHETAREGVDETVDHAMKKYGLNAKGAALERICVEWRQGEVSIEQYEAVRKMVSSVEESIVPGEALPRPKAWAMVLQLAERMGKVFGFKPREIAVPPGKRVDMTPSGKQPRVQ